MKPTAQVEAAGMRAYEQARAFEALERRRMPLIYAGLTLLLGLGGLPAWMTGHLKWCELAVLVAVCFGAGSALHWQRLKAQYAVNLELLAQMKANYGEELTWLKVEKHLAEVERIRVEMEE